MAVRMLMVSSGGDNRGERDRDSDDGIRVLEMAMGVMVVKMEMAVEVIRM